MVRQIFAGKISDELGDRWRFEEKIRSVCALAWEWNVMRGVQKLSQVGPIEVHRTLLRVSNVIDSNWHKQSATLSFKKTVWWGADCICSTYGSNSRILKTIIIRTIIARITAFIAKHHQNSSISGFLSENSSPELVSIFSPSSVKIFGLNFFAKEFFPAI